MSKARFEVSTEGMRALQEGREPWQLAKELVSNAWDEASTQCIVNLASLPLGKAELTVYDDGPGFSNIEDAWTLMGHTPKRANPDVRGRFNIGEKEILSVAESATIVTSGQKITFPAHGGRIVTKVKPSRGTTVYCVLSWTPEQVREAVEKLGKLLVPDGMEYIVNDNIIKHKKPAHVAEYTLDTVLQNSAAEPLRHTRRKTKVEIYPAVVGMLLEMGIPIQPIECNYLVNVMQKVPMPPNRDVVRDSYLQDIYRIVLENVTDELVGDDVSKLWVRDAVEDKETSPETVKAVMDKRYGDKAVLWSSDIQANERAEEHGFAVIHPKTLSPGERGAMQGVGLTHSSEQFSAELAESRSIPDSELTDGMKDIALYAKQLSKELIRRECGVYFYKQKSDAAAIWDGSSIGFNLYNLSKSWFEQRGPDQTGLILHELAHPWGNGHNWEWKRQFSKLAGTAVHLALSKPEVFTNGSN